MGPDATRVLRRSRELRRDSYALHARFSRNAGVTAATCRRLGRAMPRLMPPASIAGGTDPRATRRVILASDDPDVRDLLGLLAQWAGAETCGVALGDVPAAVASFRPDVLVIDLPDDPTPAFDVAARVRAVRERNGGRPWLVAAPRLRDEHPAVRTLDAGFDIQVLQPLEPTVFLRLLASLAVDPA
jgi:CheY-like chemotaxis protein